MDTQADETRPTAGGGDARLASVLESLPDAIVVVDAVGAVRLINSHAEALFGYPRSAVLGRHVEMLVPERLRGGSLRQTLARAAQPGEAAPAGPVDTTALRGDGTEFPAAVNLGKLAGDGDVLVAATVRDQTRAREAQRALERLTRTDDLTGIPNRRAWDQELPLALARARRSGHPVCVALTDLNAFKAYNDDWGHPRGDALLREVAAAWQSGVRDIDFVARYGGDEFAFILPDCDLAEAEAIFSRLSATTPGGQSFSVGIASWDGAESAADVVARADADLYEVKSGRRRHSGARSTLRPSAPRWSETITTLLATRAVAAVFQPIVRLDSGDVVGFEALARPREWGPDRPVHELFAAADRLGFARELEWTCRRAAIETAAGSLEGALLFLNVGTRSLLDPVHGVDLLLSLLRSVGRQRESIVLEINEREPVRVQGEFEAALDAYRSAGFRIAFDNVGEGASRFSTITAARPDFIKLGRSLTASHERAHAAMVGALLGFGRAIGAQVVAEGIESDAEARRLREMGVPLGQGWAIGPPREVTELRDGRRT